MYDIEKFIPPAENEEFVRKAAEKTVKSFPSEYQSDKHLVDNIIAAYYDSDFPSDGFQMGKVFERFGYRVDSLMVEYLDDFEYNLNKILDEERKNWIEQNNIKPELSIGTILENCVNGSGEIVGVCEYSPGYYLIKRKIDGDNSKLLVKFEDAIKQL